MYAHAVDYVFRSMEVASCLTVSSFRAKALGESQRILSAYLAEMQANGRLILLAGRLPYYESVLQSVQGTFRDRCIRMLQSASELAESEENPVERGTLRFRIPETPEQYL